MPTTTTTEPVTEAAGESTEPDPTFVPNGETVDVRSLDNTFIQQDLEVEAGTEVNRINGGRNDHNILPVDDSLNCGIAAGMIGAIIVTEPM